MAWNLNTPTNATKIRLDPSILQAQWNAIETGGVPYDTLRLQLQGAAPARVNGHGFIYALDPGTGFSEMYYEDDRNPSVNTQLTNNSADPTPGIGATSQLLYGSAVVTSGTYQNTQNAFCSAWGIVEANGSLGTNFGIASVTVAASIYTVTFTSALSSANYAVNVTCFTTESNNRVASITEQLAASFKVRIQRIDSSNTTTSKFMFSVFGGR